MIINSYSSKAISVLIALCILLPVLLQHSVAHQQKAAITKVLFNPRTDNIEVMHRFNLHDAEHAVKEIFGKHADILGSEDTRQQFSAYVNERFEMRDQADQAIELRAVGHEIDGKYFWVYQESPQNTALTSLKIRHFALRDIWQAQINTVNIEGKGKVKTLTFADSVELLQVEF